MQQRVNQWVDYISSEPLNIAQHGTMECENP
jgi:hypothetical protein